MSLHFIGLLGSQFFPSVFIYRKTTPLVWNMCSFYYISCQIKKFYMTSRLSLFLAKFSYYSYHITVFYIFFCVLELCRKLSYIKTEINNFRKLLWIGHLTSNAAMFNFILMTLIQVEVNLCMWTDSVLNLR